MSKPTPKLSVLALIMINVIAIDSLRTIPISASYGFAAVFYYVVCALMFFIPSALVSAELTTAWPEKGGIYLWVREAFGKPLAFSVIFIIWIYNICWYPTILSLLAAALAYVINPALANNTWYMLAIIFSVYWLITIFTLRGVYISSIVSTVTAILGTLIPMIFIVILGAVWVAQGRPTNIDISLKALIPEFKLSNMVLLNCVLFGMLGMEMSAVHVQDVENPQKNYPKAIYYSTIIILFSIVLASLAVAVVAPPPVAGNLDLVTAMLDAFNTFFAAFNLEWLKPLATILIIVGVFGQVGAWVLGPARGLLAAASDGCIPKFLQKENAKKMPTAVLITQGVIFSIVCLVFLVMPTINSSFWILSNLTTQLAFSAYIFIFAAAIRLRYKHPEVLRVYRVPFGNFGMWVISVVGILACLFSVLIGYVPPSQVAVGNLGFYEGFLLVGFFGFYLISFIIYKLQKQAVFVREVEVDKKK